MREKRAQLPAGRRQRRRKKESGGCLFGLSFKKKEEERPPSFLLQPGGGKKIHLFLRRFPLGRKKREKGKEGGGVDPRTGISCRRKKELACFWYAKEAGRPPLYREKKKEKEKKKPHLNPVQSSKRESIYLDRWPTTTITADSGGKKKPALIPHERTEREGVASVYSGPTCQKKEGNSEAQVCPFPR